MLKFFRKIRQELISENRVSKYMLYAIGEILLVVIGILIALQINNRRFTSRVSQQNFLHEVCNNQSVRVRKSLDEIITLLDQEVQKIK